MGKKGSNPPPPEGVIKPSPPPAPPSMRKSVATINGSDYIVSKRYIKFSEPIPMESDTLNGQWAECKELI